MSEDKLDEFLQTKEAEKQQKRQKELEQLNQWKESRDPAHLQPLIRAYAPVLRGFEGYRAPTVSPAAFHGELQKQLIGAFETFDPSRGNQLLTHVTNRLQKVQRFNSRYQNTAFIPEGVSSGIGKLQRAQFEIQSDEGVPPTVDELASHLGWTQKQVQRVMSTQRKDVPMSALEQDTTELPLQRLDEVMGLLPQTLTSEELAVFNKLYGKNGERVHSSGELAQHLGKSPSYVSRMHQRITNKIKKYL